MRYAVVGLIAAAGIALAATSFSTPASAQHRHGWHGGWHHGHGWHGRRHWHRGPRVGFFVGGPRFYGAGRCVRERVVRIRPSGTRVVRWVTRCY